MSFTSNEKKSKRKKKITKPPCNLHFFISKLWIQSRPLILSRSFAVEGSCWLWRWKTLVWQLSKTHTTLNVTCIAKLFYFFPPFHVQYGGDDQKDRDQGRSSNMSVLQEPTTTKQPSDPHELLLRIVHSKVGTSVFVHLKMPQRLNDLKTYQKGHFKFCTRNPWGFLFFNTWN